MSALILGSSAVLCMAFGALLMLCRMSRQLDEAVAAAHRCRKAALSEQRQRHESLLDQIVRDYNCHMNSLAGDIAQRTAENDVLRDRLAHTTGAVNAWVPKTERGKA